MTPYEFYSNVELFKHSQNKSDELAHYGTKGQRWGTRHWQNYDGTFNQAGKERYFGSGKSKNGVSDYLKFKKTATDEPAKEFGDFPGLRGLKKVAKNLKEFKFGSTDQPAKEIGSHTENNDISDKANEIYKKYKPNEWRRILNTSDYSWDDAIKIENELNKKLYKEDKRYAKIVNDENVRNALQEYINSWDDVIKESNRIYSKEFMDNNPEAKDWSGDGTEYWYEFADKDISNRDTETYWKLREAVSSLSHKHGKWDNDMLDKVMSDLTEPVEDTTDESSKAYDKIKERIGIDFKKTDENNKEFGGLFNKNDEKKALKEAEVIMKDINSDDYSKRYEAREAVYNDSKFDPQYNNAINTIKEKYKKDFDELDKLYGDFDKDEIDYLALAGLTSALMSGDKMDDISYSPRLYIYDDLNQGSYTAEALWAYDHGINDSWNRWDNMIKKENESRSEIIKSMTDDGSYNAKVLSNLDDGTKEFIADRLWNNKIVPESYWTLYNAGDTTKDQYDSVKNDELKAAKQISKKLSSSCGSDYNGWYYLDQAIDNLNLGSLSYKDLTDSDWNRINAEVNKLKVK